MNTKQIAMITVPASVAAVLIGFGIAQRDSLPESLSGNTMYLKNDVGETIIVRTQTIKQQPDLSKENLTSMADAIQRDVEEANEPLDSNSVKACKDLEYASKQKADWERMQKNPYAGDYSKYINQYAKEITEYEPICKREMHKLQLEKTKLKEKSSRVKDVVTALTREKGWLDYTPTYKYKILVTDVNGTTTVQQRTVVCMTEKAVATMPDFLLKSNYPYAQTKFDSPESLTLTSKAGELTISAVVPSDDALQIANQRVCEAQGYLAVIPDLAE